MSFPEKLIVDKKTNEVINLRTQNSETIYEGKDEKGLDRFRLTSYVHPINIENKDGSFDKVDLSLTKSGKVRRGFYNISLYKDKIGYYGTDPNGKKIELELELPYVKPEIKDNRVLYKDVCHETDFELVFLAGRIRANRILKKDSARKTVTFRSFREEGAQGRLLNIGWDALGKEAQLEIKEKPTLNSGETRYVQKWTSKVKKQDPVTRKSTWSQEVKYPVTIDPTSTFNIAAYTQDGFAIRNTTTSSALGYGGNYMDIYASPTPTTKKVRIAWHRFSGITLPSANTVNTAVITQWAVVPGGGSQNVDMFASDVSNPAVPTINKAIDTVGGTAFPNPPAAGVLATTAGNIGAINNTGVHVFAVNYDPYDFNVKTMIDTLVTSYGGYVNQSMVFFTAPNGPGDPATPYKIWVYGRAFGTAKDARLVIVHTAPVLISKTVFQFV